MREIIIEAGVPPEVRREVGINVSNRDPLAVDLMDIESEALQSLLRGEGYIGVDDKVLRVSFVADPDVKLNSTNRPVKIITVVKDVFDRRHKCPEPYELSVRVVDGRYN